MIPDGWEIKKLHECCEIKGAYGSGSPSTVYTSSLPRYIRITDITDDGKLKEFSKVSVKLKEENEQYTLEDGDFLFARSGATVGKTYLYRKKDGWAIYAGYLIRFKTNKNVLLPEYLEQYTQSQVYRFWVKSTLRAGAQPNINAKEYGGQEEAEEGSDAAVVDGEAAVWRVGERVAGGKIRRGVRHSV